MKNILIFQHYRAGSTLFRYLLSGSEPDRDPRLRHYLPTDPPEAARGQHIDCGNLGKLAGSVQQIYHDKPFVYHTHIGNWWGNKKSDDTPEPYEDSSPMRFSMVELSRLPGDEWVFVNILRDGRNLTESLRCIKGGIEERLNAEDPADYFKALCMAFRNKARIALDCQKALPNYRIFHFEDILGNTVETVSELFDFIGLKLDRDLCEKRAADIRARKVGKKHTSFKDDTKMNQRWHRWTENEVNLFKIIAGRELIELGYEKDNSWRLP